MLRDIRSGLQMESSSSIHPSKNYKQYKGGGVALHPVPKKPVKLTRTLYWTQYIEITADSPLLTYESIFPFLEKTKDIEDTNRIALLCQCLYYIFKPTHLTRIFQEIGFQTNTSTRELLNKLTSYYVHLHRFIQRPKTIAALRVLQSRWKKRWESGQYFVNADDPITMEPIASLKPTERWSYRDTQGNAYAFHAPSLNHFITSVGAWNPYTRLPFRPEDLVSLKFKMTQIPPVDFTVVWKTPKEAFLDVLYDYERLGFYTLLDWFIQLTPMNIIHIYQYIAIDLFCPREFFSLEGLEDALIQDPENGAAMCYAKDLKKLIDSNHVLKFYSICVMFVALATVCPILRSSIPSWTYAAAAQPADGETGVAGETGIAGETGETGAE